MLFLALIVALVLLQLWGSGGPLHADDWYQHWRRRLAARNWSAGLQLAVGVLLPVFLVHWLLDALESVLFGLLWIAAAALLLLYSFGRGDFRQLQERYRNQSRHGDFEGAYLRTSAELGVLSGDPRDPPAVHAMIQRAMLYEGYQRWFAVVFYFLLLGPAVALGYRLLQMAAEGETSGPARRCLFLLDWVPARLLASAFSLTGNFVASSDELLVGSLDLHMGTPDLLYSVAAAATDIDTAEPLEGDAFGPQAAEQNEALSALLSRSAACWVVVISLLVVLF